MPLAGEVEQTVWRSAGGGEAPATNGIADDRNRRVAAKLGRAEKAPDVMREARQLGRLLVCAAILLGAAAPPDPSAARPADIAVSAARDDAQGDAGGGTGPALAELRHRIVALLTSVIDLEARLQQRVAGLEQSTFDETSGARSKGDRAGAALTNAVPRPLTKPFLPPRTHAPGGDPPRPFLKPDLGDPEATLASAVRRPGEVAKTKAPSGLLPVLKPTVESPPSAARGSAERGSRDAPGPTATVRSSQPSPGERRIELTAAQMDAVTAGLATIHIDALAVAAGPETLSATDVETHALTDEQGLYELAYGTGEAVAAGEVADTRATTDLFADGEVVVGSRFSYGYDLPGYSESLTGGFVVSIEADHPSMRTILHRAKLLAAVLERDYRIAALHAKRGQRLLERDAERGERYIGKYLQRDHDRMTRHFETGVNRLLRVLETDRP